MGEVLVPVGEVLRRWTRPDAPPVAGGALDTGALTDTEALQLIDVIATSFAGGHQRDLSGVYLEALRRAPINFDEALEALVRISSDPRRAAFVPTVGDIIEECRPRSLPLAHRPFVPDGSDRVPLSPDQRRAIAEMRALLVPAAKVSAE